MTTDILDAPPTEAPKWRIVRKLVDDQNADTGEFQEMWLVALNREVPFRMNSKPGEYGMTDHVIVTHVHVHKQFGVEDFWYTELCIIPADEDGHAEESFIFKNRLLDPFPYGVEDDQTVVQVAMWNLGML